MEIYEPLKPPEIERDEMGRFDRHGKTLAKTAKKAAKRVGLINNSSGNRSREPDGRFKNGGARSGAGRPPGSPNKVSARLKDMILQSLDELGGVEYLKQLGLDNSSAYASILNKVLPSTLAADESNGGAGYKFTFERIITWPDGRREVEGATPKALPAPATPDASGT